MRDLIQVGTSQGQIRFEDLRTELDGVASGFAKYLEHYPAKTRSSAHGLLGPVRKAVNLALKPLMTVGQVAGRVARMHEMAQGGRPLTADVTTARSPCMTSIASGSLRRTGFNRDRAPIRGVRSRGPDVLRQSMTSTLPR